MRDKERCEKRKKNYLNLTLIKNNRSIKKRTYFSVWPKDIDITKYNLFKKLLFRLVIFSQNLILHTNI